MKTQQEQPSTETRQEGKSRTLLYTNSTSIAYTICTVNCAMKQMYSREGLGGFKMVSCA